MALALTPDKSFDYVLECDRSLPEEQQTIWHLRALTVAERQRICDGIRVAQARGTDGNVAHILDAIRCGLQGWTNFRDPDGNEAEFVTGRPRQAYIKREAVITDDCLERIPGEYMVEIGQAIIQCSRVEEGDRKN